jgi:hypothetical protein
VLAVLLLLWLAQPAAQGRAERPRTEGVPKGREHSRTALHSALHDVAT